MVMPFVSPAKDCGKNQSLRFWAKIVVVPSLYVTLNPCPSCFPLTAVASKLIWEYCPDGRVTVVALTASAMLAGPKQKRVPPIVCCTPVRFAEYAVAVPFRAPSRPPPENGKPSVAMAVMLYAGARFTSVVPVDGTRTVSVNEALLLS